MGCGNSSVVPFLSGLLNQEDLGKSMVDKFSMELAKCDSADGLPLSWQGHDKLGCAILITPFEKLLRLF